MKKSLIAACVFIGLSGPPLFAAAPSFAAGLGFIGSPGSYDAAQVNTYVNFLNGAGVTLMNPSTPQRQGLEGVHAFAQISWLGFMARANVSLGNGSGLSYYYDQTARVTVDDKLLLASATLWIGPIVDLSERGSVYACIGPTYMYGEYRDKQTTEGVDASSWDRQYAGGGLAFPVMLGAEARILPWLGVAVECVALSQQVMVSTNSKPDLAAANIEQDVLLVPSTMFAGLPLAFWLQLTVGFHF